VPKQRQQGNREPISMLEELEPARAHWHHRAQRHRQLLGSYARHITQVALALALRDLDVTVEHLPLALNFPAHISSSDPHAVDDDPVVLHFHHRLDSAGLLKPTGLPQVDAAIHNVNAVLERETTPAYRRRVRPRRGLTRSFRS
jgi:hypothetical protein